MPRTDHLELARQDDGFHLRLHFHPGQLAAWDSPKRIILVLAGWQSGKSVVGPPWLYREMQRRGPGDYFVGSPNFPLMMKKVHPEFMRFFKRTLRLGSYSGQPKNCFTFSEEGCQRTFGHIPDYPVQIFFGHAQDPDSLESATYKAAWLDEWGQKSVTINCWEAINGRLAIHQGRCLITTRPFDLGWLKNEIFDRWVTAKHNHPYIDVVNFVSIDNPAFPKEEWERAQQSMPPWKFRMKYQGEFTRPAGLIYDCFDPTIHIVPRFQFPSHWPRYLGLDFGPINAAGVFFAGEMNQHQLTGRLFAYREYYPRLQRSCTEHAEALLRDEPGLPLCVGGAPKTEDGWREAFRAGGLPVIEPAIRDVEVGIASVYGAMKRGELLFFHDLERTLQEIQNYSRELDDQGESTDKIDSKSTFHVVDSIRYLIGWLKPEDGAGWQPTFHPEARSMLDNLPPGVFGR